MRVDIRGDQVFVDDDNVIEPQLVGALQLLLQSDDAEDGRSEL